MTINWYSLLRSSLSFPPVKHVYFQLLYLLNCFIFIDVVEVVFIFVAACGGEFGRVDCSGVCVVVFVFVVVESLII